MFKECPSCKEKLLHSLFSLSTSTKSGLKSWCKKCCMKSYGDWAKRNPDKVKAMRQKYRKTEKHKKCCSANKQELKEYYTRNKDKFLLRSRIANLKKFGLTLDSFNGMLDLQNGVCKICLKTNKNGKSLAVDHDHITGKIRGLLCTCCNTGIGKLGDNVDGLNKALLYIRGEL